MPKQEFNESSIYSLIVDCRTLVGTRLAKRRALPSNRNSSSLLGLTKNMTDLIRKIRNYGFRQSVDYGVFETKRLIVNRLLLKSYSLGGEDLIIDRLCGYKKNGFYVDVGACHPTRLSNTRHFYDKGWRGINIEANPSLLSNFGKIRPRDINLNVGVGTNEGKTLDFFVMFPPTLGTFSREFMEMNRSRGHELVRTEKVQILKLSTILEQNLPKGTEIDFFSIDAEGHDFDVAQSNNWNIFRPKVVCIESPTRYFDPPFAPEIFRQIQFFNQVGYELAYHNGMDCFYIRSGSGEGT